MEAGKYMPARQLFATGRAPTALAAFIKRPQAVRFKSALTTYVRSNPLFVKENIMIWRSRMGEFASLLSTCWSDLVFSAIPRCAVTGCARFAIRISDAHPRQAAERCRAIR